MWTCFLLQLFSICSKILRYRFSSYYTFKTRCNLHISPSVASTDKFFIQKLLIRRLRVLFVVMKNSFGATILPLNIRIGLEVMLKFLFLGPYFCNPPLPFPTSFEKFVIWVHCIFSFFGIRTTVFRTIFRYELPCSFAPKITPSVKETLSDARAFDEGLDFRRTMQF